MKYFQNNQYQTFLSEKTAVNSPFAYSSYALSSGVGSQAIYTQWASTATLEFHYNTSKKNLDVNMNGRKGVLGEKLMHDILTETGGWVKGSPAGTKQGIDGLYFKFGIKGRLDVLVGEAKYGGSELNDTAKYGKQMAREWIISHLKNCSRKYAFISKKLGSGNANISMRPPPKYAKTETIPFNKGKARIWQDGDKVKVYVEGKSIDLKDLIRRSKAIAQRLQYATDSGMYRARLFRYKPQGDTHHFEISKLDKYGNPIGHPQKISGKFNKLPKIYQYVLRKHYKGIFQNIGLNDEDAKIWTEKCCENPAYFKKFQKISRWSIKYGPHVKIFAGGLMSGILGCSIDAGIQFLRNRDVDIRHSLKIGALSSISFIGGTYTSIHLHWIFTESKLGRKLLSRLPWQRVGRAPIGQALSRLGGNLATVAIFAYGGWLIGNYNFNEANRQMVAAGFGAIGSSAFFSGTIGLVSAYATASTGTAISTLSGITAYNATMAWIGGGPLIAGGFGVSGGVMILSGGTFIVAIGLATGVNLIFRRGDANSQKILIKGKVLLIEKRVAKGEQPEWEKN